MTKYLRVKEAYCGFIPVQYVAILAACITLAFQITFSIFFLIYGQLYGLIPMAATVLSHLFFIWIISQFKSTIAITIFISIEVVFAFTILGFSIWILSWILDPTTSFLYTFCTKNFPNYNCFSNTQLFSLIWGGIFLIFFFASVFLLPIYKTAWRNIKVTRKDSDVYIEREGNTVPQVQPIFNINAAPPPPPVNPTVPQPANIFLPQQFMAQSNGQQELLTQMGTIQLNLYSIQLPQNNNNMNQMSYAQLGQQQTTPIIDQLSSVFSDFENTSLRL